MFLEIAMAFLLTLDSAVSSGEVHMLVAPTS
jgi:hypothetical protein